MVKQSKGEPEKEGRRTTKSVGSRAEGKRIPPSHQIDFLLRHRGYLPSSPANAPSKQVHCKALLEPVFARRGSGPGPAALDD
jgi:hypothetical protein